MVCDKSSLLFGYTLLYDGTAGAVRGERLNVPHIAQVVPSSWQRTISEPSTRSVLDLLHADVVVTLWGRRVQWSQSRSFSLRVRATRSRFPN